MRRGQGGGAAVVGPVERRIELRRGVEVGEVRGAEALDLLLAMNTGIPCAGTIHANSAAAAISKFMLLPALAQANLDQSFLQSTVLAALNLVVHVELIDGRRRVSELHWVRS